MRLLITAFEPFGEDDINPTIEVLNLLPDQIGDITIIKAILPTVAYNSLNVINQLIESNEFDYIINLGQAGGSDSIRIERVAININDFSIPDNAGETFIDKTIFADGENAYFATIPIKALNKVLIENNLKSSISNTAGTYV